MSNVMATARLEAGVASRPEKGRPLTDRKSGQSLGLWTLTALASLLAKSVYWAAARRPPRAETRQSTRLAASAGLFRPIARLRAVISTGEAARNRTRWPLGLGCR